MKLMLMLSISMISFNHPMTMLISVIFITLFMSIFFYLNSCNSMFSLILILLILGGMLMIFLYMISLCPNLKIKMNMKMIMIIFMFFFFKINYMYNNFVNQDLKKIFFFMFLNTIILMMMYLILTLLVVMKNLNWINSPMKMNLT
uniref:NADH dehydrogenase subunit 6 n=1 Tax=Amblyomma albolimbatum TaxID=1987572 RepID=UPI0030FF0A7F